MDISGRFKAVFCHSAIEKADGSCPNDAELFSTMNNAMSKIYEHPAGRKTLASMLKHENPWVRFWVSTQILSHSSDHEAFEVLTAIAANEDKPGPNAAIVLEAYNNGSLKSPFEIST